MYVRINAYTCTQTRQRYKVEDNEPDIVLRYLKANVNTDSPRGKGDYLAYGAIHLWRPHGGGGGGGQAQVDACGRGRGFQPHVDVHTEN